MSLRFGLVWESLHISLKILSIIRMFWFVDTNVYERMTTILKKNVGIRFEAKFAWRNVERFLRYYLWCYSILMGEILTFIFYILLEEFWVLLLLYSEKYVETYFFPSYLHNSSTLYNSNVILYCFIFFIAHLGSCPQWKTCDVTLFGNLFFYFFTFITIIASTKTIFVFPTL